MSRKQRGRRRAAFIAVAGLLLVPVTGAFAAGPPIVNQVDRVVNETSTQLDVHPCTGQAAELTLVETGLIHFSYFEDGTVHISGTLRGSFSADALPADGIPDATGSYVVWFGANGLVLEEGGATGKAETAITLTGRGTNADGSVFRFHQNAITVFDADGVPKLDFANAHCR